MATRMIKRGSGGAYTRLLNRRAARGSHRAVVPHTLIERRIKHWKEVSAIFGGVCEQVAPAILEELQSIAAEIGETSIP